MDPPTQNSSTRCQETTPPLRPRSSSSSFLFIDICWVLVLSSEDLLGFVHMAFLPFYVIPCVIHYYSFIFVCVSDNLQALHFCLAGSLFDCNITCILIFFPQLFIYDINPTRKVERNSTMNICVSFT